MIIVSRTSRTDDLLRMVCVDQCVSARVRAGQGRAGHHPGRHIVYCPQSPSVSPGISPQSPVTGPTSGHWSPPEHT